MWEQVREVPGDATTSRLELDGVAYDRVPDSGWTMLVAWLAGPEHLVRLPDDEQHLIRVATAAGAGTEPRTPADQEVIDDGIDEYLADAHVPGPPRGYRWYQRLPQGYDDLEKAYRRINAHLRESDPGGAAVRPGQLAPLVAVAVADLYPR
ncbi:DUF5956 family protein [Lentzea sp. NPDC003310]|uniref:DUF5956 family protein n=1 Tax=Lentzea sp. NPDC003310 TaxID=3154447 RepID=UPI0033BEAFF4